MSQRIPPPDTASLLPPLLACLPTGFASPRPPPALLPLLSPILRQRVQLLSATAESPTDSWLPLLCWEARSAEKLAGIVESDVFELHPVSGEIEYGEPPDVLYRQLDEETLQARVQIDDLGLVVLYLWCVGDHEGGGDGWRVSEVMPSAESTHTSEQWRSSIQDAQREACGSTNTDNPILMSASTAARERYLSTDGDDKEGNGEGDDDDYWAQYDKTPGRTPAINRSPMRGGHSTTSATTGRARTTSESEYYEQYPHVQPEMDNDDPAQNHENIGESSLNGNVLTNRTTRLPAENLPNGYPQQAPMHDLIPDSQGPELSEPTVTSPTALLGTVPRLEDSASIQSNAEVAIRQHVSTSIKSLFRLCRTSGIDRLEFDDMVRTELETLSMLGEDD